MVGGEPAGTASGIKGEEEEVVATAGGLNGGGEFGGGELDTDVAEEHVVRCLPVERVRAEGSHLIRFAELSAMEALLRLPPLLLPVGSDASPKLEAIPSTSDSVAMDAGVISEDMSISAKGIADTVVGTVGVGVTKGAVGTVGVSTMPDESS